MMTTITCPHCGKPFEMNEALEKDLRKHIEEDVKNKSKEELTRLQEKAVATAKEKFVEESKLREEELAENRKQNKELREQLSELMKQLREEKTVRENAEVAMQKKLLEEQEKIRQKAKEEESEKYKLQLKENEIQKESMRKMIEELERKGRVGSQQLQGEAQELELEKMLPEAIKTDVFEPIPKGELGADIRQTVKTQRGNICGTILWESKRTKAWDIKWIAKLKEDRLRDKANVAAIVSDVLPEEVKSGMGCVDGIWVCSFHLAVPLALLLHKAIEDSARQKFISDRKQTDAEQIYSIVTSHEFVQQVESMMETYKIMLDQITKERNAFEKTWKLRETQVQRLMSGVSGIVGQLEDAGGTALSSIKGMELPSGEEVE